jgi:hypothetical protein
MCHSVGCTLVGELMGCPARANSVYEDEGIAEMLFVYEYLYYLHKKRQLQYDKAVTEWSLQCIGE